MHTIIVTGASRGIGQAIVARLASPGKRLLGISREQPAALAQQVQDAQAEWLWQPLDLADLDQVQAALPTLFGPSLWRGSERLWLINNAGALAPVKWVGRLEPADVRRNISLNLIAPLLLTNAFVAATQHLDCPRLVVNISSGAAKRPIDGWSAYCSAKAGLDMATRALALEQAGEPRPVRVLSFAPGIVDTRMQEEIRSTPGEDFSQLERFIAFKAEGRLAAPAAVADLLVRYLEEDGFENGALVDYRELLKL
jgi:benzil reductase ((S)-benzoin forming)